MNLYGRCSEKIETIGCLEFDLRRIEFARSHRQVLQSGQCRRDCSGKNAVRRQCRWLRSELTKAGQPPAIFCKKSDGLVYAGVDQNIEHLSLIIQVTREVPKARGGCLGRFYIGTLAQQARDDFMLSGFNRDVKRHIQRVQAFGRLHSGLQYFFDERQTAMMLNTKAKQ